MFLVESEPESESDPLKPLESESESESDFKLREESESELESDFKVRLRLLNWYLNGLMACRRLAMMFPLNLSIRVIKI